MIGTSDRPFGWQKLAKSSFLLAGLSPLSTDLQHEYARAGIFRDGGLGSFRNTLIKQPVCKSVDLLRLARSPLVSGFCCVPEERLRTARTLLLVAPTSWQL